MNSPYVTQEQNAALQVQDSAIIREIQNLREDMGRRFDDVDKRIDKVEGTFEKVVTRDLFDSTVKRLEIQDENIQANMRASMESVRGDMNKGFEEVKAGGRERTTKNRWLMGAALTGAGVISAVTFGILSIIVN